jgi:hypothetical protein
MASSESLTAYLAALAILLPAPALAASGIAAAGKAAASGHSLLQSRELWATIDVCNAPDQPNYVGIRGSMPGDGRAKDKMYMRFRLQYMNARTKSWVDLANAASGFLAVGSAKSTRQDGLSFKLTTSKPAFTLRGVVGFQWRRGANVVASASRPTTAGRQSLAGADPAGFSAATCLNG